MPGLGVRAESRALAAVAAPPSTIGARGGNDAYDDGAVAGGAGKPGGSPTLRGDAIRCTVVASICGGGTIRGVGRTCCGELITVSAMGAAKRDDGIGIRGPSGGVRFTATGNGSAGPRGGVSLREDTGWPKGSCGCSGWTRDSEAAVSEESITLASSEVEEEAAATGMLSAANTELDAEAAAAAPGTATDADAARSSSPVAACSRIDSRFCWLRDCERDECGRDGGSDGLAVAAAALAAPPPASAWMAGEGTAAESRTEAGSGPPLMAARG
jgi:hypothetical protein